MRTNLLPSLSILIPAYNDESTIRDLIVASEKVAKEVTSTYEIVIVNDKSTDRTGSILNDLAKKHPHVRVIHHTENKGYGGAIKNLYYTGKYEWLFTVPGDFQIDPRELMPLIREKGEADMILGWRVSRNDPPERLRQSRIYNTLLSVLFGLQLHDVNTVRFLKSSILQMISLETESAFVDAELAIQCARRGYTIKEVPINHKEREGSVGGGGSWGTIGPTIQDMMKFFVRSLTR